MAPPDSCINKLTIQTVKQAYLGKVSCMCSNLVGNDTLLDIIPVGQAQVLLGRHIAQ